MAIMELVVNQAYRGQLVVNRFHYVASGTPAAVTLSYGLLYASGYLASRLSSGSFPGTTLAGQHQGAVSNGLSFVSAFGRDLYSATDFYEAPFPTPPVGAQADAGASPVLAYGVYGSRVRTDIRRGQKRFAGVTEAMMDAGGVLASGMMAILANVCGEIGETLTFNDEGNTLSYVPCVLGLEEYTTPSGKRAYRKYATEALQLTHLAQGGTWAPYPQVRTQVSRQYGRGV